MTWLIIILNFICNVKKVNHFIVKHAKRLHDKIMIIIILFICLFDEIDNHLEKSKKTFSLLYRKI